MVPAGSAPPPPRVVVGSSADVGVQAGQLVGNRWRLVQRIGRGAFGDIFIATNEEEQQHYGRQYAIKLEKLALPPAAEGSEPDEEQLKAAQAQAAARAVLKLEAVILSKLQKYPFVGRFIEYGRDLDLSVAYLLMSLLGENLLRLRRRRSDGKFTLPTILRFGIQAIRCIQAVHETGALHRDIKPSNFVIGSNRGTIHGNMAAGAAGGQDGSAHEELSAEDQFYSPSKIFIIDFGLARAFRDRATGVVIPSRGHIKGFRGTPRYASIHVHREEDLGRRDDLWSLFYILVEFATGDLPWGAKRDKDEIGAIKEQFMSLKLLRTGLPGECPSCFVPFMKHLYSLKFESKPNYAYLIELLQHKLHKLGYGFCEGDGQPGAQGMDAPFDWEDCSTVSTLDASLAPLSRGPCDTTVQPTNPRMEEAEAPAEAKQTKPPTQGANGGVHERAASLPLTEISDLQPPSAVVAPPALIRSVSQPEATSAHSETPSHSAPAPSSVPSASTTPASFGLPLSSPMPVPETVILSPRRLKRSTSHAGAQSSAAATAATAATAHVPHRATASAKLAAALPPRHSLSGPLKINLNAEANPTPSMASASAKAATFAARSSPGGSPGIELEDLRADLAKQRTAPLTIADAADPDASIPHPSATPIPAGMSEYPDWNGGETSQGPICSPPAAASAQTTPNQLPMDSPPASAIPSHSGAFTSRVEAGLHQEGMADSSPTEDEPEEYDGRGDGRTMAPIGGGGGGGGAGDNPQHSLNDAYIHSVHRDGSIAAAGDMPNWTAELGTFAQSYGGGGGGGMTSFVLAPMASQFPEHYLVPATGSASSTVPPSPARGEKRWPNDSPLATPQKGPSHLVGSMLLGGDDEESSSSSDEDNDSSAKSIVAAAHSPAVVPFSLVGASGSVPSSAAPSAPTSPQRVLQQRGSAWEPPPAVLALHSNGSTPPRSPRFRPAPPDKPPPAYSAMQRSFGRFKARVERSPAKPLSSAQVAALAIELKESEEAPAITMEHLPTAIQGEKQT